MLHGASEHHVAAVRIRVDAARLHAQPDQVDGERVAFSGQYNGQTDVYVVPVDGGTPERLTWHPSSDEVQGWAPDVRVIQCPQEVVNGADPQLDRAVEKALQRLPDEDRVPVRLRNLIHEAVVEVVRVRREAEPRLGVLADEGRKSERTGARTCMTTTARRLAIISRLSACYLNWSRGLVSVLRRNHPDASIAVLRG